MSGKQIGIASVKGFFICQWERKFPGTVICVSIDK